MSGNLAGAWPTTWTVKVAATGKASSLSDGQQINVRLFEFAQAAGGTAAEEIIVWYDYLQNEGWSRDRPRRVVAESLLRGCRRGGMAPNLYVDVSIDDAVAGREG